MKLKIILVIILLVGSIYYVDASCDIQGVCIESPPTTIINTNNSFYNATYNNLLAQTCNAGEVVNGTLANGTLICIAQTGGSGSTFLTNQVRNNLNTTANVTFNNISVTSVDFVNLFGGGSIQSLLNSLLTNMNLAMTGNLTISGNIESSGNNTFSNRNNFTDGLFLSGKTTIPTRRNMTFEVGTGNNVTMNGQLSQFNWYANDALTAQILPTDGSWTWYKNQWHQMDSQILRFFRTDYSASRGWYELRTELLNFSGVLDLNLQLIHRDNVRSTTWGLMIESEYLNETELFINYVNDSSGIYYRPYQTNCDIFGRYCYNVFKANTTEIKGLSPSGASSPTLAVFDADALATTIGFIREYKANATLDVNGTGRFIGNLTAPNICYSNGTNCPASTSSATNITAVQNIISNFSCPQNNGEWTCLQEEFLGSNSGDGGGFQSGWTANSQGGGSVVQATGENLHYGIRRLSTSTTNSAIGNVTYRKSTSDLFLNGNSTLTMLIKVSNGGSGEQVIYRFGYLDGSNVDANDGAYFEINESLVVMAKTAVGGSRTINTTTYTITDNSWRKYDIIDNRNFSTSSALPNGMLFYINNTFLTNITTNLPAAGGGGTGFGAQVLKSFVALETNGGNIYMDKWYWKAYNRGTGQAWV